MRMRDPKRTHFVTKPVQALLMRSRRTRNLFALLVLERLLIEQRPTRHQNEIISLKYFDDETIEYY